MCRANGVGGDPVRDTLLAPASPDSGQALQVSGRSPSEARGGARQRTMYGGDGGGEPPASSWYRRKVSEGTKGPMTYEFARQRVTLCKEGLPDRTVWLVIKRTLGAEPSYTSAISNAPASTPLRTFVWLSGLRWAVEQCFEEGKTELGMDHYEVRKYAGWHHHMLTTMLAHFFLWHLKL